MNTETAESSTAKTKLLHKELTGEILGGFFTVYNALGYGFLEHVYSNALSLELQNRGLSVEREVGVEVQYQGQPVGLYRMDMIVERTVVVEIKSAATLFEADRRQLFNYQRAANVDLGLLLHFGPMPSFKSFIWAVRPPEEDPSASSVAVSV